MPITALEADTVTRAARVAQKLVAELKPMIEDLNAVYNAADIGVKATLTQPDLDGVPAWSGLTVAQVDDGVYALTTPILGAITTSYEQLTQLAARAAGPST